MVKTLKEILSPENIKAAVEKVLLRAYWPEPTPRDCSVHRIENVDGDPHRVRAACRLFEWQSKSNKLLNSDSFQVSEVTWEVFKQATLKCLEAMAAAARVSVLPERPPCSPYCDHTREEVVHEGGYGGPDGVVNKVRCGHCGRGYEYEHGTGKWYELDAESRRIK